MKNRLTLVTVLLSGAAVVNYSPAYAATDGNWYAGISGDVTWPNHADTGGGGNIDLGYRFPGGEAGNTRLEAEIGYHTADGEGGAGSLRYFDYMANAYYDFAGRQESGSRWQTRPYIGAGIGMATMRRGQGSVASTFRDDTNAFAYQGMAGLAFSANEATATEWTLGYRYFGTDREDNLQVNAHNIELGLRYHF